MNQQPYNPNPHQPNSCPPYQPYPQQPYPYQGYYQPPQYIPPNMDPQYLQQMAHQAEVKRMRGKQRSGIIGLGFLLGATIIAYLIIQTVFVLILQGSSYYQTYLTSSTFQSCFNIVAVHMTSMLIPFTVMALILKKNWVGPLVPLEKVGKFKTCAWVALGMGCCMVANMLTNLLVEVCKKGGYELTQPEILDIDSPLACVALIVSTAVVPAIFEEYGFRCCALGIMRKYGNAFAVIATSVMFGLVHGNVIQFVFAFMLGLVFGYITIKTNSVLPAMLIHGLNNGISVVQDILKYTSGGKVSETVVSVIMYTWMALAVAALVYFIYKKEFKRTVPKQPKEEYELSLGAKLACLLPGLAIPFGILIFLTSQYVTKIK